MAVGIMSFLPGGFADWQSDRNIISQVRDDRGKRRRQAEPSQSARPGALTGRDAAGPPAPLLSQQRSERAMG